MLITQAIVVRGHQVASGNAGDPRFPRGTIAPQLPFFEAACDLVALLDGPPYPATINLRIPDAHVVIAAPEIWVEHIRWTENFPPESFFLSPAALTVGPNTHSALLYIPDPATKPDHFQPDDTIELLAAFIHELTYDMTVTLHYSPHAIHLVPN